MSRKAKTDPDPHARQKAYKERVPQRTFGLSADWWARLDALRRDGEPQAQTLRRAISALEGNARPPVTKAEVLEWIKQAKEG